jgi:hypothetical protein
MDDGERAALERIALLPEPRRSHMRHLHQVIRCAIPDADVRWWDYAGGLVGYGTYAYRTRRGAAGDWFAVGLASRKRYISLYSMGLADGGYLVEAMHDRFPGTRSGKSCLNITDPESVDDEAVRDLARTTFAQFTDRLAGG